MWLHMFHYVLVTALLSELRTAIVLVCAHTYIDLITLYLYFDYCRFEKKK